MKKIATIIGFSFGLLTVQAQVGINKDKPDTTLDIVAEKTDGSQVEGLLVPRISKEAAYNMATTTTQLQESNLVYVDNLSATFTAPTGDTTVTDITEKGYYFWSGSKWERITSIGSAEWVYNSTTKQTNLKRSGTTPFANKVLFTEKGNYINYNVETSPTSYWDYDTDAVVTNPLFDPANVKTAVYNRRLSSKLEEGDPSGLQEYKTLHSNTLIVDSAPTKTVSVYSSLSNSTSTSTDNTSNYSHLQGVTSSVSHSGLGDAKYLIAQNNGSRLRRGTSTGYVMGTRSAAQAHNSGNAKALYSSGAFTVVGKASNVTNVSDFYGYTFYGFNTSATVNSAYNLNLGQRVNAGASPKITNAAALYYRGLTGNIKGIGGNTTGATITNNYGILLEDIIGGTDKNYAIYTKAGKNSFGDAVEIRNINTNTSTNSADKVVVADATTGELKVKEASDLAGAEWVYNSTTKQTNLKRSGTTPFANKVLFTEKGNYINYNVETSPTSYWDYDTDAVVTNPLFDPANVKTAVYNRRLSSKLEENNPSGLQEHKALHSNALIVDSAPSKAISVYNSVVNLTSTSTDNTSNYSHLQGVTSSVSHSGLGDAKYLIAQNNASRLRRGTSTGYVMGTRSAAQAHNSGNAKALYSSGAFTVVGKASNVTNVSDFYGYTSYGFNTSATVNSAYNLNLGQRVNAGASPKITNAAALYYRGLTGNIKGIGGNTTGATITNNYGILLEDIIGGTDKNYAIYTKAGKVHLGDDVTIGTTAAPKKLEVNGDIKVQGTGTSINDGDTCTNPGTISYGADNNFYGCAGASGASFWKKLHN